jgi:putative serine/threonine protein kinase
LVQIHELAEEPYSSVIGYPRCGKEELEARVKELTSLGVKGVIFDGETRLGKIRVLGKGCVGIVVKAVVDDIVALKMRRLDADRESMERESSLLKIANSVEVGPRLIASSRNFLLSELAHGVRIREWVKRDLDAISVRKVALQVLEQCFRLDSINLDHGELSNLSKHVIVNGNATIVDFESASTQRRASNVTAAAQCMFISGEIARKFRSLLHMETDVIIEKLKEYKNNATRENFERILHTLKL